MSFRAASLAASFRSSDSAPAPPATTRGDTPFSLLWPSVKSACNGSGIGGMSTGADGRAKKAAELEGVAIAIGADSEVDAAAQPVACDPAPDSEVDATAEGSGGSC